MSREGVEACPFLDMARGYPAPCSRTATEWRCPSSPSASASAMVAGASAARLASVEFQKRGALHEIEDAKPRGEARRPRGRQNVIRPAGIIAHGFRRVMADEDRTGIAVCRDHGFRLLAGKFEVLGGERIHQSGALPSSRSETTMTARNWAQLLLAMAPRGMTGDLLRHRRGRGFGERGIVCSGICAGSSCSACDRRSGASQRGFADCRRSPRSRRAGDHVDARRPENVPLASAT